LTTVRVVAMLDGVSDPNDETLAELADVTGQLGALHAHQDALVARARAAGASWARIAAALGVSAQAAHKRYRDVKLDRTGRAWKDRRLPM
jgi:hypothetical protein